MKEKKEQIENLQSKSRFSLYVICGIVFIFSIIFLGTYNSKKTYSIESYTFSVQFTDEDTLTVSYCESKISNISENYCSHGQISCDGFVGKSCNYSCTCEDGYKRVNDECIAAVSNEGDCTTNGCSCKTNDGLEGTYYDGNCYGKVETCSFDSAPTSSSTSCSNKLTLEAELSSTTIDIKDQTCYYKVTSSKEKVCYNKAKDILSFIYEYSIEHEGDSNDAYCSSGYYYSGTGNTCNYCPIGYYCTGGSFTKDGGEAGKQKCDNGKSTLKTHSTSKDDCKEEKTCPAGYYYNKVACEECPVGYYCPNVTKYVYGYTSEKGKTACAKGYYQNLTGQTSCNYCGDGMTTDETGSTKKTDCYKKSTTTYTVHFEDTNTNYSENLSCETTESSCLIKTPGAITRAGYVQTGWSTSEKCTSSIRVNESITVTKTTTYYACWEEDTATATFEGNNVKCAAGTFYIGNNKCNTCTAGYYCPSETIVTKGSTDMAGRTKCPKGTASREGATECTNCVAGTYADEEGLRLCKYCPSGQTSKAGASSCYDEGTGGSGGGTGSSGGGTGGSSGGTGGSSSKSSSSEKIENAPTGSALIYIVWTIGVLMIGYSIWFFRKNAQSENN